MSHCNTPDFKLIKKINCNRELYGNIHDSKDKKNFWYCANIFVLAHENTTDTANVFRFYVLYATWYWCLCNSYSIHIKTLIWNNVIIHKCEHSEKSQFFTISLLLILFSSIYSCFCFLTSSLAYGYYSYLLHYLLLGCRIIENFTFHREDEYLLMYSRIRDRRNQ